MLNRREVFSVLLAPAVTPAAPRQPHTPAGFKAALKGPILSFPTVYTPQYGIDAEAVRKIIEQGLAAGVRVIALTNGNNHYDRLTYDEIKSLTRAVVETVSGRGLVIAATGPWWTGQATDYARYATSLGADAVQVLMPPEGSDASYAEHFKTVARSTPRALVIHGKPSMELFRLLRPIDNIVAFKEEFTPDYTLQIYQEFGDRWNIFAGGTKARLLTYRPYGMRAYYSAFSTFAPQVALRFWRAVENNDIAEARQVVIKYDVPFFKRWSFPFWAAALEHFGLARRYVRPPAVSFSEEQMKEVGAFFRELGL